MKIGIIGFGTVGGGVGKILKDIEHPNIEIQKIAVKNIEETNFQGFPKEIFTQNYNDIINDPQIDAVVEVMGGTSLAKIVAEKTLENKKHYITANKALLADFGNTLFPLAKKNGVKICFEASIAGGIPIVDALKKYLSFGEITKISGILNGTCNYMLCEMEKGGRTYEEILKDAQEKGFAESDPTFDVEAIDATQKLALLRSLAFKEDISDWKTFTREGITNISPEDFKLAKKEEKTIRLIAEAEKKDGKIHCCVKPMKVLNSSKFAGITGAENFVLIEHEYLGTLSFSGQGAGRFPTAHAVVHDILSLTK